MSFAIALRYSLFSHLTLIISITGITLDVDIVCCQRNVIIWDQTIHYNMYIIQRLFYSFLVQKNFNVIRLCHQLG